MELATGVHVTSSSNHPTGGDIVCEVLKAHDINTVFCLAGVAHANTLYSLHREGFHIVSSRHESATVAQADGYARVTGKPGIAMVVGYQGLPSVLAGVRTAQLACSPVVLLVSVSSPESSESADEESNDGLDMVKLYVKWARTVPTPERLKEFLLAAINQATTGRPGVAVLGVTQTQLAALIDRGAMVDRDITIPIEPEGAHAAIAQTIALLANAERPLVLVGSGAALSGAGETLRTLARDYGIPVFGHALGRGLVPEDLSHGFPWSLAQVAAREADVVIAAGMRLTQRIGFGMAPRFSKDAKFVQIDISHEELSRNRKIDVPIVGDANATLKALLNGFSQHDNLPSWSTKWVRDRISDRIQRVDTIGQTNTPKIHPIKIGQELMRQMPQNAVFVADGADVYNWMSATVRIFSERSYLDHYPLGSMGIGTPIAIGAAAGNREIAEKTGEIARPVVLVTGDGSFGFYLAEINSAVLAGLKVICIISNDGIWGTERNAQLNSKGITVNCDLGQCDYHLIGATFGCRGEKVASAVELAPALERAFAADETTILNVLTDPDAGLERKKDPRLQMVTFEDLKVSLKAYHTVQVA
jgi:acetolactate synthase I/II/III large subunit